MTTRDELARQRTALANERTLLAYLRTSLGLLGAAAVILHLFADPWHQAWGWLIASAGVCVAIFGVSRFRKEARRLRALEAGAHSDPN